LLKENRTIFQNNGLGKPRKKIYKHERILKGQAEINFWFDKKYGDNLSATSELKNYSEMREFLIIQSQLI
jgi:hypothetical protein